MNYVGIDLGTTNSVICTYNGKDIRLWKSPEQNDVTPSVIYIDKRGRKYYGAKAENQALYDPANAGTLFKRFVGTGEKIVFESSGVEMTAEECCAEILGQLYGYLPEKIRNDEETATVITVPASFNQMKKNAVLEAASKANLGKVALMQEPVAAVMSIMRHHNKNGRFIVYDIGGGTFDISIAVEQKCVAEEILTEAYLKILSSRGCAENMICQRTLIDPEIIKASNAF